MNTSNFLYRKYIKYSQKIVDCCVKPRYILYSKSKVYWKTTMRLTEKEIIEELRKSSSQYRPLVIDQLYEQARPFGGFQADAIAEVSFVDKPCFKALVEIATIATPKSIVEKCRRLLDYIRSLDRPELVPLLIAPYIGSRQANILTAEGVSWLDLCGNMCVNIPSKIYIERTGNKNK